MSDQPANFSSPAPDDGATMAFDPSHPPRPAGQIEIAAPLETGSRIGPYEVREHVGDGGMAAVYKVWHTGLHRFEALKIPRYQASRGPEADFLHRLLAEARTAAGLHHPHIVAIHNVSDEKSILHYFAMEFVDGSDLAALIARGPLPFDEALTILRQVGSALDYAHASGVIHRDVKPANILLQRAGDSWHSKVVDFGISRAGEDSGSTRLTRSGMIVGTPEYMSPEQSGSGAVVDQRTDVYSLGVVAYEMMCGHPPFTASDGVSRISVLMKQMNEPPMPPDHCRRDLPVAVSNAILKALAKNPEDRFESCSAFLDALIAVSSQEQSAGKGPINEARRRGTIASMMGPAATGSTPTLNKSKARDTEVGNTLFGTAAFRAPIPAVAHAVTRPLSLVLGFLCLMVGLFTVWSLRQPPEAARARMSTPPPRSMQPPAKPQPVATLPIAKPVKTNSPARSQPPRPVSVTQYKPKAAQKPVARHAPQAKRRAQTARAVRKMAHPISRRPITKRVVKTQPFFRGRPKSPRSAPHKTIARPPRSQPARHVRRGGGSALPP